MWAEQMCDINAHVGRFDLIRCNNEDVQYGNTCSAAYWLSGAGFTGVVCSFLFMYLEKRNLARRRRDISHCLWRYRKMMGFSRNLGYVTLKLPFSRIDGLVIIRRETKYPTAVFCVFSVASARSREGVGLFSVYGRTFSNEYVFSRRGKPDRSPFGSLMENPQMSPV